MTTQLTKAVSRRTETTRRDRGKSRRYVITLRPGDIICIRLEKCRQEEILPVGVAYETAVRLRVAQQKAEKRKSKLVKRGRL